MVSTRQERTKAAPVAIEPRDGTQQLGTVADEDVVPQVRVAFRNPRQVEKTAWGYGEADTRGRAGYAVGEQMGQVARGGQQPVMLLRTHHDDPPCGWFPESWERAQRPQVCPRRLRQDADRAAEQLVGGGVNT